MILIVYRYRSSFLKVGIAGEESPRSVIPTLVGTSTSLHSSSSSASSLPFKKVMGKRVVEDDMLKVGCPLDPRSPTNWDQITDLWEYLFTEEMKIEASEYSVSNDEDNTN